MTITPVVIDIHCGSYKTVYQTQTPPELNHLKEKR